MNELIKTFKKNDGTIAVDGRDLHDFLGVKTDYKDWFPRMAEYGFTEDVDFVGLAQKRAKPQGGRPKVNHALTLDMAKEVSMIQRTPKGKQAREYFIAMEKQAKRQAQQVVLPMTPEEKLLLVMENANRANSRLTNVEERMDDFEANQKMDPTEYSTVSHGVTRAVNRYVGENHLQLTRDQRAELYKDISTGLNKVCGVHTRTQIRAKEFNRSMKYIYDWEPNTATKMMMQQAGEQTAMEV
ncbi:antA/AntB antirepressor family protein [Levilactobacillus namurensis]|uniref:antA/AntB antirepressor family protein n=1 Tax=Levilactobacillus namurensis TaxID=380393 RepID=UPI00222F357B|nr:antA/AntB antirepressor family protein [Levilactobacillus namurensis]MCW3777910.1 antA/AntB antirepressor family protein [Levilactobacillus namurensis]MDT7018259.1 antA/AntB antirepressor family protein [Levilactobacillus namurensis]WNN64754.1 antA/AntB antirepressor family protein [Levilactobacillus namurensis]